MFAVLAATVPATSSRAPAERSISVTLRMSTISSPATASPIGHPVEAPTTMVIAHTLSSSPVRISLQPATLPGAILYDRTAVRNRGVRQLTALIAPTDGASG